MEPLKEISRAAFLEDCAFLFLEAERGGNIDFLPTKLTDRVSVRYATPVIQKHAYEMAAQGYVWISKNSAALERLGLCSDGLMENGVLQALFDALLKCSPSYHEVHGQDTDSIFSAASEYMRTAGGN